MSKWVNELMSFSKAVRCTPITTPMRAANIADDVLNFTPFFVRTSGINEQIDTITLTKRYNHFDRLILSL